MLCFGRFGFKWHCEDSPRGMNWICVCVRACSRKLRQCSGACACHIYIYFCFASILGRFLTGAQPGHLLLRGGCRGCAFYVLLIACASLLLRAGGPKLTAKCEALKAKAAGAPKGGRVEDGLTPVATPPEPLDCAKGGRLGCCHKHWA